MWKHFPLFTTVQRLWKSIEIFPRYDHTVTFLWFTVYSAVTRKCCLLSSVTFGMWGIYCEFASSECIYKFRSLWQILGTVISFRMTAPGVPGLPSTPGNPGIPAFPFRPGNPSKPGSPSAPAVPGKPSKPRWPFTPTMHAKQWHIALCRHLRIDTIIVRQCLSKPQNDVTRFQVGCAHLSTPAQYLSDYIQRVAESNRRRLRSSSSSQLVIRRTWLSTVGDRAFPVAGSRLWNSLPPDVASAPTLTVFRNRL